MRLGRAAPLTPLSLTGWAGGGRTQMAATRRAPVHVSRRLRSRTTACATRAWRQQIDDKLHPWLAHENDEFTDGDTDSDDDYWDSTDDDSDEEDDSDEPEDDEGIPVAGFWAQQLWAGLQDSARAAAAEPGSCWRPNPTHLPLRRWMGELNEEWGEIFVRPCWPALWAQMQMAAASQPGVPQRLALAAGARGTGRRAMMFYVLWRLSLEPGVPAVVVQTAQHECLAFTRGQRVYKGDDIASFANLLELPGTWLLTHEKFDPEISQGASASLLLITSRHFGTGQELLADGWKVFYHPPWDLPELQLCRNKLCMYLNDKDEVAEKFLVWGGNAKEVLWLDNDLEERIPTFAHMACALQNPAGDYIGSHDDDWSYFFQLQAAYGCDDFRTTNLALASEEVTTRWLDHLWEEDALLAWCLEAQQVSESVTSLEVVRRDTFRALFQKLAQDGRELRMRQLNVDGEQQRTSLDFSEHNTFVCEFWEPSELAAQPALALCIPKHPGALPLAHAVLPSGWVFHAVLDDGQRDGVKAEDVVALAAALPAGAGPLRLVWCVPQRLWGGFTARHFSQTDATASAATGNGGIDVEGVQQYALEVRMQDKQAG